MKRALSFTLIALLLFTVGCADHDHTAQESEGTPIYFLAPADSAKGSDALQRSMEILDLPPNASLEAQATAVTERLLRGSVDGSLRSPVPEDTQLVSVSVRERRVHVDLSGSFARMDGIELTLADYCLTLSLSAIHGIESVTITVAGRLLAQQPHQIFRERDVILSTEDSRLQLVDVLLYFANANGELISERRTLEVYEGETQASNLISALMDGPANEELSPILPTAFTISSVKVENGVCRISLPGFSLSALPDDEAAQRQILLSLTQSLYSLDSIREIRFSADGIEIQRFGMIPLSEIAVRAVG